MLKVNTSGPVPLAHITGSGFSMSHKTIQNHTINTLIDSVTIALTLYYQKPLLESNDTGSDTAIDIVSGPAEGGYNLKFQMH